MKKLLLLLFIVTSCSSSDPIREKIEAYALPKLNDPDRYEFVEINPIDTIYYIDNINIRKEMATDRDRLNKIRSIEKDLGDKINDIASFTYIYKFRANNAVGAKILNSYFIQTDQNNNVINMTDKKGKLFRTPNVFPGFDSLNQ